MAIDNGAASYIPLSTYLIDNEAFDVIRNAGKHVFVHSVIAGGMAQANTVSDFATLVCNCQKASVLLSGSMSSRDQSKRVARVLKR